MVKKKIRKFFNTVSIHEKSPVLFEECKKKNSVMPWWFTALGIVTAAVVALWFVLKDMPQSEEMKA